MHGYQPCHFNHQQTPKLKPLTSSTTINPPRWPPVEVGPSLKCQNRHVESYLEDPRPQGLGSWEMSWSCDSLRLPVDFTNGSRSRKGNQGFLQWRYAQTRPTFTHKFLWLWGSPHSMTQMPLLRKLRWCAHRCVPSPQDLEIWNYLCFTSESTRRWVDLRPKTPSLLCVVYHLYMLYLPFVYIYIYVCNDICLIWRVRPYLDHGTHSAKACCFRLGPFDWRSALEHQSHQMEEA